MSGHPLDVEGGFGRFADSLLVRELPDLPDDRRFETVEFVSRRAHAMPTPLRLGVTAAAVAAGVARGRWGDDRTTAFLATTRLPVAGELARLVRSLAYAYVWETWPTTTPTGADV